MGRYRNLLLAIGIVVLAATGCDPQGTMGRLFERKKAEPKRGEKQLARDPLHPREKGQVGIHYDPRQWVENAYDPGTVAERITSPGFKGMTRQTFTGVGGDHNVHINATGEWMAYATTRYSENPQICVQSVKGKAVTLITEDNMSDMMPKFSPRGNEIAWCSNRSGNWDIWVQRTDTLPNKQITQLTRNTDDDVHPSWSFDGKLLAFSRFNSMDGVWQIWIMDYHNRTVSNITEGLFPEFCPIARKKDKQGRPVYTLAYQRNRNRDVPFYSIWTIDVHMASDGKVEAVDAPSEIISDRDWAAINPAWSPDGNYLAFATVRRSPLAQYQARLYKADDIFVVRLDGTDLTQITKHSAPDWDPFWAKDPTDPESPGRLYFVSNRSGQPNVWSVKPLVAGMLARAVPDEEVE